MLTNYFVYITTNPAKTVFYIGVTNNLERRISEHRTNRGKPETFAGKYYCYKLIYFEEFFNINEAIDREKELKHFNRIDKIQLIKTVNPDFNFIDIFPNQQL